MLAINDGTFPALLKTLSDPSDQVVTRDLQLLSQISHNSEDDYFTSFMVSLLSLFSTDRRLLETRGNLIIRHLCVNLNPERIYRTLADILEKDEDVEFASIMVQNLNNNLMTAPELADLRKRLRSLDTKDGQTFFVSLFRSWCHNAVATFSLCLLAQAYEQASNLLQILFVPPRFVLENRVLICDAARNSKSRSTCSSKSTSSYNCSNPLSSRTSGCSSLSQRNTRTYTSVSMDCSCCYRKARRLRR